MTLTFLDALFPWPAPPGLIELRFIYRIRDVKPVEQVWLPHTSHAQGLAGRVLAANAEEFNVYFGPGLRRCQSGDEADVIAISSLWADLDGKDFNKDIAIGKRLALEALRTKLPPELQPSILVDSGNGFQPYWLLKNPLFIADDVQRDKARSILAGIGDLLNGDYVHDLGRIMRLPGTVNVKDPANPKLAEIVQADYDRRFEIDRFDSFAVPPERIKRAEAVIFNPTTLSISLDALRVSDKIKTLIRAGKTDADKYPSRSEADAAVAAALANGHHTDDEIRAVFSNPEWRIGERYQERGDGYLQRTIGKARDFVAAHPLPSAPASPATASPRPLSFPLSAIFDLDSFPEQPYIVKDLIRVGSFGYIGGEAKRLKSMKALSMALDIASGLAVFGRFEVEKPWKVFFIEEEDDIGLLRTRLERFRSLRGDQWPSDEHFRLAVRTGLRVHPTKDDPDDLNPQFQAVINEIADFRPDIVFFDALNRLHDGEENSQKDMTRVLGRFEEIRRRFGTTVLLIHHFNKAAQGKSGRANQRLRGSSVISSWSENSLYVMGRDRDDTLTIDYESKYGPSKPFAVRLEQVSVGDDSYGLRFVYKGDPVGRKQAENKDKVFTALTDIHRSLPDDCTVKSLAHATGMKDTTVRNCLHELEDEGRVDHRPGLSGSGQSPHVYSPRSLAAPEAKADD